LISILTSKTNLYIADYMVSCIVNLFFLRNIGLLCFLLSVYLSSLFNNKYIKHEVAIYARRIDANLVFQIDD